MRPLLLLLLLASPLHADTVHADTSRRIKPKDFSWEGARKPSVWPGLAWAAVPAAMDLGATWHCMDQGWCVEGNQNEAIRLSHSPKASMLVGKAGWVLSQTMLDRRIRQSDHPKRVWVLRVVSAGVQLGLASRALRAGNGR